MRQRESEIPGLVRSSLQTLRFLESGELADFALKCEDYEWKVHRLILASGSNVFQKACAGDFKVRVSNLERENATKEVDLALPHKQLPSIVVTIPTISLTFSIDSQADTCLTPAGGYSKSH
jgi:hypothetical protein